MLDGEKKVHRPERLKGYNYTAPGYYFVTFNTKLRGEDILCTLELQSGVEHHVGPDPQVRPFLQGGTCLIEHPESPDSNVVLQKLTPAGEMVKELVENIDAVYSNVHVDCYVIMPDHVHLLLRLEDMFPDSREVPEGDGLTWGSGPTKRVSLSQVVKSIKGLSSRRLGYSPWQDHFYDHIIRNREDLQSIRQYILTNPQNGQQARNKPPGDPLSPGPRSFVSDIFFPEMLVQQPPDVPGPGTQGFICQPGQLFMVLLCHGHANAFAFMLAASHTTQHSPYIFRL